MRDKLPLLVLLITAMAAVTAAVFILPREFDLGFGHVDLQEGLALAQVQLAAASVVLVRRRLVVRVAALVACVLFWSIALAGSMHIREARELSLLLLSAALFTGAWCGVWRFLGWRLASPASAQITSVAGQHQFSLATLLLVTTIVAIFAGLWQLADMSNYTDIVFYVLICCLPGCSMLHITSNRRWQFVPVVLLAGIYFSLPIVGPVRNDILAVIFVQCAFLGVVMLVLRIAGIRLVRDAAAIGFSQSHRDTEME